MEVKDFLNKELIVMVIKLLTELRIAKLRKSENFNKKTKI